MPINGCNRVVVGISDMKISSNPNDYIVTYSLGSCLGVTVYDPVIKVAGMIHCMLPISSIDTEKAKKEPYMFVDTGLPILLNKMFDYGADKKRLIIKIAGCASILDDKGLFKIGERNLTVARKLLWKNSILIKAVDAGGAVSRTLSIDVSTGTVVIKSKGVERELV
ncbi:MAG: chemotaxis protein CheD [Nitrospirae bacterium]|nr:chemotaxis protein CheD [Nitrospirota bacterium]MBF0541461.1 chemotaxis protein CheD [Nitrospirota bacterium]